MIAVDEKPKIFTAQDFDEWVNLPDHIDGLFEFIAGEMFEVPSNPYSSKIGLKIGGRLMLYVEEHDLGHVTSEAGGYEIGDERYAPDVAFVSKERQDEVATQGYNPIPPDLAVAVVSPSDSERKLRIKVQNYLAAGVIVWVVYPETGEVEIYQPHQPVQILSRTDTLRGSGKLDGFQLPLSKIFPDSSS